MSPRLFCLFSLTVLLCFTGCDDGDNDGKLRFAGRNGIAFEGDGFDRADVYCAEYSGTSSASMEAGKTEHRAHIKLAGRYKDSVVNVDIYYFSKTTALEVGEYLTEATTEGSTAIYLSIGGKEYRSILEEIRDYGFVQFSNVDSRLQGRFEAMLLSLDTPGRSVDVAGSFDVENKRD